MRAYVEARPHSYLLTLHATEATAYPLATALRQVLRHARGSVWVDCRHVSTLSAEALLLLRRCASLLWRHGGHLIVCHLPEATRAGLAPDASQPLAASVLDAAQYGLAWPAGH
ncbi:hypothetical protein FNT36_14185 [Hymenobacter setariae]|uniref:STAS domain-containing protein n=1 Tax=Hymenobacter setariae TaxID=2594794 RepID=A0A558BVS5_9BACT|nr:hypothetical protein [Hymenobacter setariae]TVT40614.1 hypothetical protein FNT36_14185 [Hymenobacter setariae]